MATMNYKCPNCDGPLRFDPDKQLFTCEYCLSEFPAAEVQAMNARAEQRETYDEREVKHAEQAKQEAKQQGAEAEEEYPVSYTCPSCGAEVVTTSTTAATTCFYCYNPVVLGSRLSGEFNPDRVIKNGFYQRALRARSSLKSSTASTSPIGSPTSKRPLT